MRKPLIKRSRYLVCAIVTPIVALLLAFLILCFVTMGMYTPVFLKRVLFHWDSSVNDYKIFSERLVAKGENPYVYQKAENPAIGEITIAYSGKEKILNDFIGSTQTTSFIVAKNDRIVYEKYANGYDENSVNTSFSMAKSIVSLLVGKAIEKGHIQSAQQPISDYITEFQNEEIGTTTIEELLLMRSKIVYDEDKFLWFGDDSLTYWHDDLRKLALRRLPTVIKGNFTTTIIIRCFSELFWNGARA